MGYRLISGLVDEVKQSKNWRGREAVGPSAIPKGKAVPSLPSNFHSQPRALTSNLLLSREVWCHPSALLLPHYVSCLKGERKQEAGLRPFWDCIVENFNKLGALLSHVEVQSTIQPKGSLHCPQTCSCCSWKHTSSWGPHPGEVPAHPPAAVGYHTRPRRARNMSLLLCLAK